MSRRLDDQHKEFLEKFDSAVNLFMSDDEYRELAEKICNTHRTLQQNKMRLIVHMLQVWADQDRDGWYDLRNEATVKLASKIVDAFKDDFHMPVV
jgi:hypothetical protein